jgi:ABC-type uncharacterized transport system ATPase subunit
MKTVEEAMRRISEAAASFEGRWTMRALARVDADLATALQDQIDLFNEALITSAMDDVREQGEALIRGYVVCTQAMQDAQEPDDAYLMGKDPDTGLTVAIGQNRHAIARVREAHGEKVVWMNPDEVAAMVAGLQSVARVKELFPGAEIERIDRYPNEPAKGDAA